MNAAKRAIHNVSSYFGSLVTPNRHAEQSSSPSYASRGSMSKANPLRPVSSMAGDPEALNSSASYSTYDLTAPTVDSSRVALNSMFNRSSLSLQYGQSGEIAMQDIDMNSNVVPPPVSDSWRRIDRWADKNYYELWCQLSYPSTDLDVTSLEQFLGCGLPQDVRESFFIHDGQDRGGNPAGLFFGVALLDIEEVEEEHSVWRKVSQRYQSSQVQNKATQEMLSRQSSVPEGAIQKVYSHPGWIPLAKDFSGNNIGIDLAPGPKGNWGQVILYGRDYDQKYVVARSWGAFLSNFADDLEGDSWIIDEDSGEFLLHEGVVDEAANYLHVLRLRCERQCARSGARNVDTEASDDMQKPDPENPVSIKLETQEQEGGGNLNDTEKPENKVADSTKESDMGLDGVVVPDVQEDPSREVEAARTS